MNEPQYMRASGDVLARRLRRSDILRKARVDILVLEIAETCL